MIKKFADYIMNYMKCPSCGYYAYNGYECFDCGYIRRLDKD